MGITILWMVFIIIVYIVDQIKRNVRRIGCNKVLWCPYVGYPVVSIYQPMWVNHQTCDRQYFIQLPNHTHIYTEQTPNLCKPKTNYITKSCPNAKQQGL